MALTACATDEVVGEDGRDDAFTSDGKLDGFSCTPAEAAAILQLVNTASRSQLQNNVHLATKAADNIVAYRLGDDETANTNDDETFGTLAELDAIPYVGPIAFQKLLMYVHDHGLVGPPPPPSEWHVETIANGADANFALTPSGRPVVVFNANGWKMRRADGTIVAMPTDTSSSYMAPPELAIDDTGIPHIIYRAINNTSTPSTSFKHASYRNGQWTQHAAIPGTKIWVDQDPTGKILALAQTYACGTCSAALALHNIAADGTTTTEQLWTVSNDTKLGFSVGNDGFPSVAYGSQQVRHARRAATGWRTFNVNPQTISADSVATTGGANATVFAAYDGMSTYRQNGTTFSELQHLQFIDYTPAIDAAMDTVGTAHGCFQRNGNLVHVQADTTGNVSEDELGVADDRCWLGTDSTGKLHLFFTIGNVINHATYE